MRVEHWLREHATSQELTLDLMLWFHSTMFGNVFPDLAGKTRGASPSTMPLDVDFGNYLGTSHGHVPEECARLFAGFHGLLIQLDELALTDPVALRRDAPRVAAYIHCEIVRIHPFANGNGRTARACANYVALRYGKRLIPFDRPRGEYIAAVGTWLQLRVIDHFVEYLQPMWLDND